jgi:hypothetical protein
MLWASLEWGRGSVGPHVVIAIQQVDRFVGSIMFARTYCNALSKMQLREGVALRFF